LAIRSTNEPPEAQMVYLTAVSVGDFDLNRIATSELVAEQVLSERIFNVFLEIPPQRPSTCIEF
jgi:hypothetical protein